MRVESEVGTAAWLAGTVAMTNVHGHGLPPPGAVALSESFFEPLLAGNQKTFLASLSP